MCWSMGASVAMVGAGAVATGISLRRGDTPAIPATFAYFTAMEALQVAGYAELDRCGAPANQVVALLSYLHIAFQPLFINAFAMAILQGGVARPVRAGVFIASGLSAAVMLVQLYPFDWAGPCPEGALMCSARLCVVSGDWHIAWEVPWNGLVPHFSFGPFATTFPTYALTVFLLPVLYGAWRFALYHLLAGPTLASLLTSNQNEMPAVWCLFSIGLLTIGLLPALRRRVGGQAWPMLVAREAA
jgi:hypothetical protein